MTDNSVFHDKSKHIEIWYFYIRDMVQKGAIKHNYVSTDEQVADVLTNPLSWVKFEYFHDKLGVVQKDFPCKEEQWWDYRWWRYGPSSKRRNKSKIWTLLEKEEQVEDMNPPRTKGEQVDNMDPPEKWGVMMRLTSMMAWKWCSIMEEAKCAWIWWQGLTFICGRLYPILRMEGITLCSWEWSLIAKDGPVDVTLA